jgi:hypothetical protein
LCVKHDTNKYTYGMLIQAISCLGNRSHRFSYKSRKETVTLCLFYWSISQVDNISFNSLLNTHTHTHTF